MDWDRLRIFRVVAEAGSLTKGGDELDMSQPAVSRQVAALEEELGVILFHRHARGLKLTEQGDHLYRAAQDMFSRLETARTRLIDSTDKPFGDLRVTTTVGLGSAWLTPRLVDFVDLYPDINLQLLLNDNELDLSNREADVALWLREPTQNDLIRKRLFTVHFHIYGSVAYLQQYGRPKTLDDLDEHRIITFAGAPTPIRQLNWLVQAEARGKEGRRAAISINNLQALRLAVGSGAGLAVLPDYMVGTDDLIVPVLADAEVPDMVSYFVYPEELRNSKRLTVFRDFLFNKARQWRY
ncbi:MAG: LysR family transcriptional regulator [Hyphomicrobiaceae bacterium]|nr:LysR family transcriptional regulator [Hyphomicrobiaceae bacterium]